MDGKLAYDVYQSQQGRAIAWVDREAWKYEEASPVKAPGVRARAAMRIGRIAAFLRPSPRQERNADPAAA